MEYIIKRYRNRKLYDTVQSRYVTLQDIERILTGEGGEALQVVDNTTGEDITRQILVQIIMEREKGETGRILPLEGLRNLIAQGGSSLRSFVQKTMDRGILNMEQIRGQVEKFGDWISRFLNERLRRGLLHIPTRSDWTRVHEKVRLLEANVDRLISGKEEK